MTPISRPKQHGAAKGLWCSSRPMMCTRQSRGRGDALLRSRAQRAAVPELGLPALRPRFAQARYRKQAAGNTGRTRAPHEGQRTRRRRHHGERALQRVPPRDAIATASFFAQSGKRCGSRLRWSRSSRSNGYARAGTVREPGDFALRGGIVDLWPPGAEQPLRLDFFGEDARCHPPLRCRNAVSAGSDRPKSNCCPQAKPRSIPKPSAASAAAMWRRSAPRGRRSAL